MRKLLSIVIVLLFFTNFSIADYGLWSGNKLYRQLKSVEENGYANSSQKEIIEYTTSTGFILGVCDGIITASYFYKMEGKLIFDLTNNVTTDQIIDVVYKFLDNHPEERNAPASGIILKALAKAFPARKGNS